MTRQRCTIKMSIIALTLLLLAPCKGAGLLKPINSRSNDVFMKSHHVKVTINNGFARTEVDQVFGNKSDNDLEAIYSFPLPKQASLAEFSLWINNKEITGEVLEKQKARQIYQQQKNNGNDTGLAEKNDYKTFDIKVYPVRAKAQTRVRLVYYQPLKIDCNVGRYVYPLAEGGVDEERIAFWSVDDKVHESFRFDLTLKSAFPVKDVRVPGYDTRAVIKTLNNNDDDKESHKQTSGTVHTISIDSPEGDALTRDIVVYYRLNKDVPARLELVPYCNGTDPGTFMVVVTPAADLAPIRSGTDWTFVLDISGSMGGGKIATLIKGISQTIGKMSPNDRFRIITFNQKAHDFSNGYITASPANVQSMLEQIKRIRANGSTNLFAGIKMAYNGLDDDRTTGIILVTDGVANVGKTQHSHFLNLLNKYDIRLFTFVIGNSANQPLMDRLARDSGGFAMNISDNDDIIGRILQAKAKILYNCMHDVKLSIKGKGIKDITPKKYSNLYQGQQLSVLGRYTSASKITITLNAKICGKQHQWQCTAQLPAKDTDNPELERLWALSAIDEIMEQVREHGETKSLKQQIISLGTEYSLVTDYTSMVVLSETEMENKGIQRKNAQRVHKERLAQQTRQKQPVHSYRVDNQQSQKVKQTPRINVQNQSPPQRPASQPKPQKRGMFNGRRSPGFGGGTGPVGPLFMGLLWWARRRSNSQKSKKNNV